MSAPRRQVPEDVIPSGRAGVTGQKLLEEPSVDGQVDGVTAIGRAELAVDRERM